MNATHNSAEGYASGPWKIGPPDAGRFPAYRILDPKGSTVALVPIVAAGTSERCSLIAAAPYLLLTCRTLLADFTSERTDESIRSGPFVQILRAAIAMAEGRS